MIDDFKKSIQLVLSERIANPFSGAFFFSWLVWNWKLVYFLIAADSTISIAQRISYIEANYLSFKIGLFFPLLSAVFLITIYPFITTGALWVWLKFKKWQTELKNGIEGQRLLTAEQSLAIRLEIQNQEDKFDRLLKSKDDEIDILQTKLSQLQDNIRPAKPTSSDKATNGEKHEEELTNFLNNKKMLTQIPILVKYIQSNYNFSNVDPETVGYFTAYNLIRKKDGANYDFTEKGKAFLKEYYRASGQNNAQ